VIHFSKLPMRNNQLKLHKLCSSLKQMRQILHIKRINSYLYSKYKIKRGSLKGIYEAKSLVFALIARSGHLLLKRSTFSNIAFASFTIIITLLLIFHKIFCLWMLSPLKLRSLSLLQIIALNLSY
jgi:hypothetical protein